MCFQSLGAEASPLQFPTCKNFPLGFQRSWFHREGYCQNRNTSSPRFKILPRMLDLMNGSVPIIGAGRYRDRSGISAKFEAVGGADLIIVYNSGRFQMGIHGSLAGLLQFKDANAVMLEMGTKILPITKITNTPFLACLCH